MKKKIDVRNVEEEIKRRESEDSNGEYNDNFSTDFLETYFQGRFFHRPY